MCVCACLSLCAIVTSSLWRHANRRWANPLTPSLTPSLPHFYSRVQGKSLKVSVARPSSAAITNANLYVKVCVFRCISLVYKCIDPCPASSMHRASLHLCRWRNSRCFSASLEKSFPCGFFLALLHTTTPPARFQNPAPALSPHLPHILITIKNEAFALSALTRSDTEGGWGGGVFCILYIQYIVPATISKLPLPNYLYSAETQSWL